MDKIVIKNNKFRMKNKTVSNKAKGGLLGALLGVALKFGLEYIGIGIPEELIGEAGGALAAVIGSAIGGWFAPADDPETIESAK